MKYFQTFFSFEKFPSPAEAETYKHTVQQKEKALIAQHQSLNAMLSEIDADLDKLRDESRSLEDVL